MLPGTRRRTVSRRSAALALAVLAPDAEALGGAAGVEARRYPVVSINASRLVMPRPDGSS